MQDEINALTSEKSAIARRLTDAARRWAQPDAVDGLDHVAALELTLDALNELNYRANRIADLESAIGRSIAIIDSNLYHQREKVEDAVAILRAALRAATE